MSRHNEPWTLYQQQFMMGADGEFISFSLPSQMPARVIACVNACTGLDTSFLLPECGRLVAEALQPQTLTTELAEAALHLALTQFSWTWTAGGERLLLCKRCDRRQSDANARLDHSDGCMAGRVLRLVSRLQNSNDGGHKGTEVSDEPIGAGAEAPRKSPRTPEEIRVIADRVAAKYGMKMAAAIAGGGR